jgi:hypothetical protein
MLQLAGAKRWLIFPPRDVPFLYPDEHGGFAFDPFAPNFERFPLARLARPVEAVVRPGEVIFVPSGSPHAVGNVANEEGEWEEEEEGNGGEEERGVGGEREREVERKQNEGKESGRAESRQQKRGGMISVAVASNFVDGANVDESRRLCADPVYAAADAAWEAWGTHVGHPGFPDEMSMEPGDMLFREFKGQHRLFRDHDAYASYYT